MAATDPDYARIIIGDDDYQAIAGLVQITIEAGGLDNHPILKGNLIQTPPSGVTKSSHAISGVLNYVWKYHPKVAFDHGPTDSPLAVLAAACEAYASIISAYLGRGGRLELLAPTKSKKKTGRPKVNRAKARQYKSWAAMWKYASRKGERNVSFCRRIGIKPNELKAAIEHMRRTKPPKPHAPQ